MRGRDLTYVAVGIAVLLAVKYVLFGLVAWNLLLHPTRMDDPNGRFAQPFLGLFAKGKCNGSCS